MVKVLVKKDVEIWADDLLGRSEDARFLIDFLSRRIEERGKEGRTRSYVLNLNAQWGQGKTFFLCRLRQQLEIENYLVVHVNAWEDDHADDPLIAVMSAIDDVMKAQYKAKSKLGKAWIVAKQSGIEIAFTATKYGLAKLAKKAIGEGVESIAESLDQDPDIPLEADEISKDDDKNKKTVEAGSEADDKNKETTEAGIKPVEKLLDRHAENILNSFRKGKKSIKQFRKKLGVLLEAVAADNKRKTPLFILIDELDRCRPTYAITLLERVKHLFDVDNVVFIVATDSEQLGHSINSVYGEKFDSSRYLIRFFDRTYVFEEPALEEFVARLFDTHQLDYEALSSPPENDHKTFFIGAMHYFDLDLRSAEQCFDMIRSVLTVWPHRLKIELLYLLPLVIVFQQGRTELFNALAEYDTELGGRLMPDTHMKWTVNFLEFDESGMKNRYVQGNIRDMLFDLISCVRQPLPKIVERGTYSGSNGWVRHRFDEEFQLFHGRAYQTANPPTSVMQSYPELVRNVGRLMQASDADGSSGEDN